MTPGWCSASDGDCLVHVVVVPRASRSRVVGEHDGRLKVQLAAPPVDGEANQELVRMLSEWLGISRSQVELVNGQTSKRKSVRIRRVELPDVLGRLEKHA